MSVSDVHLSKLIKLTKLRAVTTILPVSTFISPQISLSLSLSLSLASLVWEEEEGEEAEGGGGGVLPLCLPQINALATHFLMLHDGKCFEYLRHGCAHWLPRLTAALPIVFSCLSESEIEIERQRERERGSEEREREREKQRDKEQIGEQQKVLVVLDSWTSQRVCGIPSHGPVWADLKFFFFCSLNR